MKAELRYVSPDERIVLDTGLHWAILIRPAAWMCLAIVAAGLAGFTTSPGSGSDWVDLAGGAIAVFFAVRFVLAAGRWARARILVTGSRLIQITGVLSKKVTSLPLESIGGLSYERSLLGRVLGFGTIVLGSGWPGVAAPRLEAVPAPDHFYRVLLVLTRPGVGGLLEGQVLPQVPPDQADTGPIPRVVVERDQASHNA